MTRAHTDPDRLLELARREHATVEVILYWDRISARALVVLWNWQSGTCLRVDVDADRARDAFTHPCAYAAAHGVPARVLAYAA
ncbi:MULTISPECIES: hypothetical protein [unclassified Geodermatophilus]